MPGRDVLQPQDPVEPAAAVGGGGGPGRGQHRAGGRGPQLDAGRAQAAAGRRVPGVERPLCTVLWRELGVGGGGGGKKKDFKVLKKNL